MSIIGKGYFINSNSAILHVVAPTGSTIIARNNAKSKTLSTAIGTPRLDRTWVSDYYLKIPSIYYGNWVIQGISQLGENLTWGNDGEYLVVNNDEEYLTSCYFYAPILEYDDLEYILVNVSNYNMIGIGNYLQYARFQLHTSFEIPAYATQMSYLKYGASFSNTTDFIRCTYNKPENIFTYYYNKSGEDLVSISATDSSIYQDIFLSLNNYEMPLVNMINIDYNNLLSATTLTTIDVFSLNSDNILTTLEQNVNVDIYSFYFNPTLGIGYCVKLYNPTQQINYYGFIPYVPGILSNNSGNSFMTSLTNFYNSLMISSNFDVKIYGYNFYGNYSHTGQKLRPCRKIDNNQLGLYRISENYFSQISGSAGPERTSLETRLDI